MRVACVGGGPAGLFFALLMRRAGDHRVDVFERGPEGAAFGFGVVFSRLSVARLRRVAPDAVDEILALGSRWDGLEIRRDGQRARSTGHGFAAVERRGMLAVLARLAGEAGVGVRYGTEADPVRLAGEYDVVVVSEGANSATRQALAAPWGARVVQGSSRYAWFAADRVFEEMTFLFAGSEYGPVAAHAYPYSADRSTFLVEVGERTWQRGGFEDGHTRPGDWTDPRAMAFAARTFAADLGGARLYGNGSRWLRFPHVRTERWHHGNLVGIGDAVHTAHFSVGSGTTMALEDAAELVRALTGAGGGESGDPDGVARALAAFESVRRPVVAGVQDAAWASRQIWEHPERQRELPVGTLLLRMLTRAGALSLRQLCWMDRAFADRMGDSFAVTPPAPPPCLATGGAGQDDAVPGGLLVPYDVWARDGTGWAAGHPAGAVPVLEIPAGGRPADRDAAFALCAARVRQWRSLRPGSPVGLLVRSPGADEDAVAALADAVAALTGSAAPDVVCVGPGGGDPAGSRIGQMVLCEILHAAGGPQVVYVCPPEDVEHGWTHVQAARAHTVWTLPAPTPQPASGPGVAGPEAAGPEAVGPRVAGPGAAGSEVAGPGVAGSGVAGSGVAGLGVAGPEAAGPGAPGPEAAGPGVVGPEAAGRERPVREPTVR